MATNRVLGYLESRKNLAGCACGLAGLGLTVAGVAGAYWPVVVAGLYGAGALIAPPERVEPPHYPDLPEQLGAIREDFGRLRAYVAEVELPPAADGRLTELLGFYEALLDPGWVADVLAADPEAVHALARAVRQDVPECVDTFHRTRWWARLTPGGESPERQLERQLGVLFDEAENVTAGLREAEARRQQTHTTYLEGRGGILGRELPRRPGDR
uniref:SMODS and SLOG-associating 2TM effector domain-containing protein n=1 Tax=Streptomyces sp. NBC_00049 TaxID=2903617 RepID=A0AAU2JW80_9ACTN